MVRLLRGHCPRLERLFLELGGQINHGQDVQEILIEQARPRGLPSRRFL